MILRILFVGIIFPYTFCLKFENENTLQSVLKEIENLRTDYKRCTEKIAEVDELKRQVNELREENRDLVKTVKELLEGVALNQLGNGSKASPLQLEPKGHVDSKTEPKLPTSTRQLDLGQSEILKRQTPTDRRVAFTAGLSTAGIERLGPKQTVIFDNAVTNFGKAYYPNTGIFVAPVKGAYVFNVQMNVQPHNRLRLEMIVDGNRVFELSIEIPSSDEYESRTELFIVEVNQGADVFVRADSSGGNLFGNMHSLFSGYLLFETE